MKTKMIRSTLEKAIFLAETSANEHQIAIHQLGTFYIQEHEVLLRRESGQWKQITRDNLDEQVHELVA
mgnify:CR=1 FL=1